MIELIRSSINLRERDMEPLSWFPVRMPDRSWTASLACGEGHEGLINEHHIADDGVVSPSVVCTQNGCTWHEYVKLIGWPP